MKQAAIYIRVSTDEQARHGFSLKEQESDLRRYAARKGYSVYGVYADEGTSARKGMSRRHELQRLLRDVKANRIDLILVKCLDRWFRNVADFYKVQEILDAHHVTWECSQEDYNTTTTNGRLMLNLMLSIAQNESDQTSDRIKYVHDGLKRQKKEIGGKQPLGYAVKGGRLVINEMERPVVEFIFASRLSGMSARHIADAVFERFHYYITIKRVYLALQNRTYTGERYGIADFCPAIIDTATFLQVQESVHQKKRSTPMQKNYLFSGKVICPRGNVRLVAHHFYTGTKHNPTGNIYRCNKKYETCTTPCINPICQSSNSVQEMDIENFLLQNIQSLLAQYQLKRNFSKHKGMDAEAKKKHLQAQIERLKILFIDGVIDHDEFQSKYQPLAKKLQKQEILAKCQQSTPKPMQKLQRLDQQKMMQMYHTLGQEQKRAFWQSLIERIELGDEPLQRKKSYSDFKVIFY